MASPPSDGSQGWDKWGPVATPAPIIVCGPQPNQCLENWCLTPFPVAAEASGKVTGDVRCAALAQSGSGEVRGNIAAVEARLAGLADGAVEAQPGDHGSGMVSIARAESGGRRLRAHEHRAPNPHRLVMPGMTRHSPSFTERPGTR
jgi:hypothetical protein